MFFLKQKYTYQRISTIYEHNYLQKICTYEYLTSFLHHSTVDWNRVPGVFMSAFEQYCIKLKKSLVKVSIVGTLLYTD